MKISFFASSLVSAYWNGAATYYRGIIRALHRRGHRITFYEPDAYDRQAHRDIPDPDYARVVVYPASEDGWRRAMDSARGSDLVIKASGVGVFDAELEEAVVQLRDESTQVAFWDVDAPATLSRMEANLEDPFRAVLPDYDLVLTYGGGNPVVDHYTRLGARMCVPIYNGLDPDVHFPVPPEPRLAGSLSFLGNRLPDRELRVHEFFFKAARALPRDIFILGGNGWSQEEAPPNVRCMGHVYTREHNAFNCSAKAVLNINRDSMASYGYSPATRVFEAAGAGACIITDKWLGVEYFFDPGTEWLVAENGEEVGVQLASLSPAAAQAIGRRAKRRALAHHTYEHRARELDKIFDTRTVTCAS